MSSADIFTQSAKIYDTGYSSYEMNYLTLNVQSQL